jgi:hypothetical protein
MRSGPPRIESGRAAAVPEGAERIIQVGFRIAAYLTGLVDRDDVEVNIKPLLAER